MLMFPLKFVFKEKKCVIKSTKWTPNDFVQPITSVESTYNVCMYVCRSEKFSISIFFILSLKRTMFKKIKKNVSMQTTNTVLSLHYHKWCNSCCCCCCFCSQQESGLRFKTCMWQTFFRSWSPYPRRTFRWVPTACTYWFFM